MAVMLRRGGDGRPLWLYQARLILHRREPCRGEEIAMRRAGFLIAVLVVFAAMTITVALRAFTGGGDE